MCEHGKTTPVRVKVLAHLSHSGRDEWKTKPIDSCIAPLVDALQRGGVDMLGSCCGHGSKPGEIGLADGRALIVGEDGQLDALVLDADLQRESYMAADARERALHQQLDAARSVIRNTFRTLKIVEKGIPGLLDDWPGWTPAEADIIQAALDDDAEGRTAT